MILGWTLIGAVVGLLLGVTGAGGAVVAVPLFVYIQGVTVRDATVLSLLAVLSASLFNGFTQRKVAHTALAVQIFLFSTVGSILSRSLKARSPDAVITLLFMGVAILSLISVWRKTDTVEEFPAEKRPYPTQNLPKSIMSGISLGALVTMTGLGGGVILLPILRGLFRLSFSAAAATSLLIIFLASLFSLFVQREMLVARVDFVSALALIFGNLCSAWIASKLLSSIRTPILNRLRQFLLTAVILLSILGLFFKI
ncbi:MAG: sulfite exporter TauE/SafE family protein [Bdellovibrionales bacterium]|nr:sulfite exporter TauE/SafE family protein [Bdellovibrionales bacterium]